MAGLLNTSAPLNSELSMLLQLLALSLLVISFIIVKRRKYAIHGALMFTAVLMNTTAILTIMIPVALRLASEPKPGLNFLFRSHALLGLIIEAISVYIIADWRFRAPGPTCFQRKNWMLALSLLWMTGLILGILLFMKLYS